MKAACVGAAALVLAGCATQPDSTAIVRKAELAGDEYEYRTITGSRVPVLVPKNQGALPPPAMPVTVRSPEALEHLIERGLNVGR